MAKRTGKKRKISRTTVKSMGFTDSMIKELLPRPIYVQNPRFAAGVRMQLWNESEVRAVMETDEFKRLLAKTNHRNKKKKDRKAAVEKLFTEAMLQDPASLYPETREMQRHFILHIGDTNTGKTHDALEALKNAEMGVYLAPLRLLALEVQERLLDAGVNCSMTTGEEDDFRPFATHLSCTVEKMFSIDQCAIVPEVAVIDEAQMLADPDRGWAWLRALLALPCETIHVCLSGNAENILIRIIEMCEDSYEIVRHERTIALEGEEDVPFRFPKSVRPHDALVAFSKRKVLRLAAELETAHINTSIIYGALPYQVRKEEVRKFLSGETEVLVSTDAIGMGMNLPIERIVFMEEEKYDGKDVRPLRMEEIRQIAGRAGRRGLYEKGYVNAFSGKDMILEKLAQEYEQIDHVVLRMPESLLELDMPISRIIRVWDELPATDFLQKANMTQELKLAEVLERSYMKEYPISREEEYKLIGIPFDAENRDLYQMWLELIVNLYAYGTIIDLIPHISETKDLDELETIYKKLDLIWS
ncbi:MAG: RNA helicase, partial [Eubacterium sp.]|nr:RNA helicase [Eubacterium sp.]